MGKKKSDVLLFGETSVLSFQNSCRFLIDTFLYHSSKLMCINQQLQTSGLKVINTGLDICLLKLSSLGFLCIYLNITTTIPNASDQHKANYVLLLKEITWDTDSWKGLMTSWTGSKKKINPCCLVINLPEFL